MESRRWAPSPLRPAVLVAILLLGSSGCRAVVGELTATARDEWTRRYPLAPEGAVQITNVSGRVAVESAEGSSVEIRAERIARGATDAVARELLPRITIKETVRPDLVSIETERVGGVLIGASYTVDYHVRVPARALVRARTANGPIEVQSMAGRLVLNTVNGSITGRHLLGGVEARTVNGRIDISLMSVGMDPVDLRTTNGSIRLALPLSSKANLAASVVNGPINTSGLGLELMGEQSSRRVRGRLSGGGTPIELSTVNGRIDVTGTQPS